MAFIAILLALLQAMSDAKVAVSYDKFKDKTLVHIDCKYCNNEFPFIGADYSTEGNFDKKPEHVAVTFLYYGTRTKYNNYELIVLADDQRYKPIASNRNLDILSGGVTEAIVALFTVDDFLKMVNSTTIEAKLGIYEFTFKPKVISEFRLLADHINDLSE